MLFTSDLYSRKPVSYINFVIVLDSGARGDWEGRAPARQKGVAGEYDEAYLPVRPLTIPPNHQSHSMLTEG